MFDKSYFDTLQDYIASGCTMELTADELDYYNALYALVGINRKYGKDNAVAFLMHEPFNVERMRARKMYSEAINLFYLNDTIESNAHRNLMYDNLMKAAQVVLQNAVSSKDMEVYGNLNVQAAKIKQLDKPDPVKPKEIDEKPIKIYDLNPEAVGLDAANRQILAAQIDSVDLPEREKVRLKRDANIVDIDFEEMLNDQEEKTKDIG
ncbi:hypothetical protein DW932_18165 [Bacteroides intestinalis]|jgi:uncharacterized protein with von Willebrand factor type A (vWA) domain|uniref:hypothetical protein n=1 Tax=Bacteroides intestinalis TaxID=329854 RepID=UPI000E4CB50C|nr:hypothetical protein [Bacteroides intestinalis]RHA57638.1 hypothetical protein DW932_18165 [Bacteroides intestinalis]